MPHVLVTGASGFIGSHLVDHLLRQDAILRVLCQRTVTEKPWPDGVELFQGDVGDEIAMKRAASGIDLIFHLAAKVHESSSTCSPTEEYDAVNLTGTSNVLQGAIAAGVRRFVFFSSVKAMGERTEACEDETAESQPETAYGRSKLAAERLVMEYGHRYHLQVSCLRLPLVYGPGQKGNLIRMIDAIDRGVFPPIPEFGNRRSMVHVSDVVQAAMLAATKSEANGQRYIVTDARPYSTREIYERMCRGLGRPIPRWHMPVWALKAIARVGDVIGRVRGRRFVFDPDALEKLIGSAWYSSDKISRELGYRPTVSFEEALPELIAWYRKSQA